MPTVQSPSWSVGVMVEHGSAVFRRDVEVGAGRAGGSGRWPQGHSVILVCIPGDRTAMASRPARLTW